MKARLDSSAHASPGCARAGSPALRRALLKLAVLFALAVWAFWPELRDALDLMLRNSDWVHGLVMPLAIAALFWLRRGVLAADLRNGSVLGVALILVGLAIYGLCIWPYDYRYPRDVAIVPVAAGIVWAVGGGAFLKRCLPMLLLLALSLPIGARMYAALIIRPETLTLSIAEPLLDALPGASVALDGPDLDYTTAAGSGTVALGDTRRGAALLITSVVVGVFVVFARVRPFWQVATLAVAAVPIALMCNLLRVLMWGGITIYAHPAPTETWPRTLAGVFSIVAAYVFFIAGCRLLALVSFEREPDEAVGVPSPSGEEVEA